MMFTGNIFGTDAAGREGQRRRLPSLKLNNISMEGNGGDVLPFLFYSPSPLIPMDADELTKRCSRRMRSHRLPYGPAPFGEPRNGSPTTGPAIRPNGSS